MGDSKMVGTAKIWIWRREKLAADIERLNRRAARLGVAPYVLTFGAESPVYKEKRDGTKVLVGVMVDVVLTGAPVCVAGWTLVAKYDFMGESGVIVSKSPGCESLEVDREIRSTRCDHCRTERRRSVSYLVQNVSTGARKVVGSTCLPDFTGLGRNAQSVVELGFVAVDLMQSDDPDAEGGGGGRFRGHDLGKLLSVTAMMIRTYGWCSRKRAESEDRPSTSESANFWIDMEQEDRRKHFPEATMERRDFAVAKRTMHWAKEQSGSDYIDNLAVIANAGWCSFKHVGLACSMVAAWQRHRGELLERARRIVVNPDAVVGAAGQKIATYVEVVRKRYFDGDFGVTTQVVMTEVATGAQIVWWASGNTDDLVEGERVQIAATVKKLDTYNGYRQTIVTRCSVPLHWVAPRKTRKAKAKAEAV